MDSLCEKKNQTCVCVCVRVCVDCADVLPHPVRVTAAGAVQSASVATILRVAIAVRRRFDAVTASPPVAACVKSSPQLHTVRPQQLLLLSRQCRRHQL